MANRYMKAAKNTIKKDWIKKANLDEGAFTKKAKEAGYDDVQKFARHVLSNESDYSQKTLKQARLAQTFKKMSEEK